MENKNESELKSLQELRKITKPIRNVNIAYQESLKPLEKLATWITDHVGTMGFFFLVLFWTLAWLLWNVFASDELKFDPYPAFVLWLFISNLIQLFLLPLLLIGQNLQETRNETRSEVDFEINKKSEKEIETVLVYLEHQHQMLMDLNKKVESIEKSLNIKDGQ